MRNLNEEARKLRADVLKQIKDPDARKLWEHLSKRSIPQRYVATSISDFVDNADSIKLNYWIFLLHPFFYETAIVHLLCPVTFNFNGDNYDGMVSDRTGSLEIKLRMFPYERKKLHNGMIFYETAVMYNPRHKKATLFYYKDHGPTQAECYQVPFLIPSLNS